MFIVLLQFNKPVEAIAPYFDGHIAFLNKYYAAGKFIVSGGQRSKTDESITGGVIMAYKITRAELETILQEDPFHQHQAADYEITEFVPMYYAKDFKHFIDEQTEKTDL